MRRAQSGDFADPDRLMIVVWGTDNLTLVLCHIYVGAFLPPYLLKGQSCALTFPLGDRGVSEEEEQPAPHGYRGGRGRLMF
ncbi:hypothetical protein FKX85_07995 [Echinicola soli]|uniref:Uncharacterized protein n=1 Tax=Echinicola soli TaxID=2591634 RepID=A0A514CGN1_9BACT|nr:hypothetical protein [Echinicola soli]QDH78981.1 hypothetical protein FKX85_07995 [Echinicola soli]